MAASPAWKVYTAAGEYTAATKHCEEAACLVAFLGAGSTIRYQHGVAVWTEGAEDQAAAESFDHVTAIAHERVSARGARP